MANGEGSNTTKIVLGIIGGVLVLGLLCCVGGWYLIPKDARNLMGEGVEMGMQMAKGVQGFDKGFADDFGEDGRWQLGGAGSEALLLVGVGAGVELDDATIIDLQDRAWTRFAGAFAGGSIPVSGVAIGRGGSRTAGSDSYQGKVSDWTKHVVDVETIVARTGVPAPPQSEFFESVEKLAGEDGSIQVGTDDGGLRIEVDASSGEDAVEEEVLVEEGPTPATDDQK